jgi:uncharacterized protein (DUF2252 family)
LPTIAERIKLFNSDRLARYTPLKYEMMAESAFRFFRGSCHLFYEDLGKSDAFTQHPVTWICGDLHLENFGSFKGNNRLVYFDLNDFDESLLAPLTWEIARMVTSIFIGFESLHINRGEALQIVKAFLRAYAITLGKGKAQYVEPETASGIVKSFLDKITDRKQKTLLAQYAIIKNKTKHAAFRTGKPRLFEIDAKEKKELALEMTRWMKINHQKHYAFRVIDVNFRIAGTGSVGVKRYVFLVQSTINPKKFMLIDMKQAKPSSVAPYIKVLQPAWVSEAERVVSIQDRMQSTPPALLGTLNYKGDSYVVKELQPTADKIDFLVIKDRYADIRQVIGEMGMLTASAQLRSSGRQGSAIADELIAFGNDTHWQQDIIKYAQHYSSQVKRDYQSFLRVYNKGGFSQKPGIPRPKAS